MKLASLETVGVRNLDDREIRLVDDDGLPPGLTVVTGPSGSGTTSVLDAIAYSAALLSTGGLSPGAEDVLRPGGGAAAIRTTWILDEDERRFGGVTEEALRAEVSFRRGSLGQAEADPALLGVMSRYSHAPRMAKVVSIPALRVTDAAFSPLSDFEAEQQLLRLSTDPEKFAGLPRALVKMGLGIGDRAVYEEVQRTFAALCETAQLVGVASNGQPEFAVGGGARLPLTRLPFSARNAFVLAAAPLLMALHRSVILLDSPELGLPPGVAARWLDVLREQMPEAQWIVASRDAALLARVGKSATIELGRAA